MATGNETVDNGGQAGGNAGGDQSQQDQGAGGGAVDNGSGGGDELFDSPEDRAAFEQMRGDAPGGPAADRGGASDGQGADQGGAGGDQQQVGGKKEPAAGADGDDEGDDEGDDQPGAQSGDKPPRRVSGKKYAAAAERVAKLEQELNAERVKQARIEERLTLLNEALTAPPQQQQAKKEDEDPEPDPAEDIFGHNAWLKRKTERLEKKLNDMSEGTQRREQAVTESTNIKETFAAARDEFVKAEPHFMDAYQYALGTRMVELAGYLFGKDLIGGEQLTPQETIQIRNHVNAEEQKIVANAIKNNRDPAKAIFMMAKGRGWRPPVAQQQQADQQQGGKTAETKPNGNGNGAKPNGNGQQQQPSVVEEIERINNGQKAALSLSNGGGSPNSAMTIERLLAMDDDEFGAVLDNASTQQLQRIAGG